MKLALLPCLGVVIFIILSLLMGRYIIKVLSQSDGMEGIKGILEAMNWQCKD